MIHREAQYHEVGEMVDDSHYRLVPQFENDLLVASTVEMNQIVNALDAQNLPSVANHYRRAVEGPLEHEDKTTIDLVFLEGEEVRQILPVAEALGIDKTTVRTLSAEIVELIGRSGVLDENNPLNERDDSAEYVIKEPMIEEEDLLATKLISKVVWARLNTPSLIPRQASERPAIEDMESTLAQGIPAVVEDVHESKPEEQFEVEAPLIVLEAPHPSHHHRAHSRHEAFRPHLRSDDHGPKHRVHRGARLAKYAGIHASRKLVSKVLGR